MMTVRLLLICLLVGTQGMVPVRGQGTFFRQPTIQEALKRWADPETVGSWVRAMRAGLKGLREGRPTDAEASFREAVTVCQRKASGGIQQCISRLLLAEVLLQSGNLTEATIQVDQLAANLKKATRMVSSGEVENPEKEFCEMVGNLHRYQVGAALYVRAARIYFWLGRPERAVPLFKNGLNVFDQKTIEVVHWSPFLGNLALEYPFPRLRPLRIAEIQEAQCRFHLWQGQNDKALKCLQEAQATRKTANAVVSDELFLDQLVAEPLDKSFLKRFLEDCAFYRFDDARIAELLVRQAALLKKVGRTDEATAFERFAESLRRPRMKP